MVWTRRISSRRSSLTGGTAGALGAAPPSTVGAAVAAPARARRVLTVALALLLAPASALAQIPAVPGGSSGAGLLIRQLDGAKRVLMIGAHPDDEDSSLLVASARALGARTAYLSLNRGEGGQNLIGPEMGEGLGLIRTGELVAARSRDGAEQFFTRTYDFGFTKTAEETLAKWGGEEAVLKDVVARVREFRPHVIVSVWTGTERDGHGQHTVAGIVARAAFDAAGDPAMFPELADAGIEPWQPLKLYRLTYRDPNARTLSVETGALDPLLGRTHLQVAMDGRSQHRSQDMGAAQPLGPRTSGLLFLKHALPGDPIPDDGMFAGIDTSLVSLAQMLPAGSREAAEERLRAYRSRIRTAGEALSAMAPHRASLPLAQALSSLREVLVLVHEEEEIESELGRALVRREGILQEAILLTAGVTSDFRAEDDLVVPGQSVLLQGELYNGGPFSVDDAEVRLIRPAGWEVTFGATDAVVRMAPGGLARWEGEALVGDRSQIDPLISVPYFLRNAPDGDVYRWPDDDPTLGLPANEPLLSAMISMELEITGEAGAREITPIQVRREVTYRGVDKALGEFRKPVLMVPTLSVSPEPRGMAWPMGQAAPRAVSLRVRSETPGGTTATVRLDTPDGWAVEPAQVTLEFDAEGVERTAVFSIRPSGELTAGLHDIVAVATDPDGVAYDVDMAIVDYPHIHRTLWPRPARIGVSVFPVRVAEGLRVGYIMGSGDDGAEALRQMGVAVEELGAAAVTAGDFDRFDAVILGMRAYETRPDLAASNANLLDYARAGGTVVVQYNKYEFPRGGFAPYPVEISRPHDRVTDETAPVTLLVPDAPVFRSPNRIGASDFDGWVQERGLYFLGQWDPRYQPLLAMADPGEEPKEGSLLVARVGQGIYVYTGLAFFRQFPAGVPGAYRLFANLASLKADSWPDLTGEGGRQ